jgi:plasmid stability protein
MAQFIVRDLEEAVKTRLKRRAARHGRSLEDGHILRDAAGMIISPSSGSRIAARFVKVGLTVELPESRNNNTIDTRWPCVSAALSRRSARDQPRTSASLRA